LNRCASGDHHAFEILYQETSAQLFGLVTGIVKEPDLAGKILEESYVRIWEQAGHFQADRMPPMTWMTAIVHHQIIDLVRKSATAPIVLTDSADQPNQDLHDCIGHPGDISRQAIKLAYFYGMNHQEIARCLGESGTRIKSWLRKDLLRLKNRLK
jgi:RNA polymerase sigma-70 factor (ECF subfamily)